MTTNTTAASRWLVSPRQHEGAGIRMFCVPYAGCGASVFRTWAQDLPSRVAVHAVQLPGREHRIRERPFTRMEPLVHELAEALLPYLDLPFVIFGHSMGALVGFELSRYLRARYGLRPQHLFVSAHRAPQLPNPEPLVYRLPELDFINKLRQMNGTSEEVLGNADLMSLLLPTLRADFSICGTYGYTAGTPLDCPISAFVGTQDSIARHDQVEAWRAQTYATFSIHEIPGNHFFLHHARSLLLWTINQQLKQLLGNLQPPGYVPA